MKFISYSIILLGICLSTSCKENPGSNKPSENKYKTVEMEDVDRFWSMYDTIDEDMDYSKKLELVNALYLEKASNGLSSFIEVKDCTDSTYVDIIDSLPRFWESLRPRTREILKEIPDIEGSIDNFKNIYPELKPSKIFLYIGCLTSGGTTKEDYSLLSLEIVATDSTVVTDEFEGTEHEWLLPYLETSSFDFVALAIHEYVHTQQKEFGQWNILSRSLREGIAEFITELVMGTPRKMFYIDYGHEHLQELKAKFKNDLLTDNFGYWYGGENKDSIRDLGYFMGYVISKSYYENIENKAEAIRSIIQLDYQQNDTLFDFLNKSKFYEERIIFEQEAAN